MSPLESGLCDPLTNRIWWKSVQFLGRGLKKQAIFSFLSLGILALTTQARGNEESWAACREAHMGENKNPGPQPG